MSEKDQSKKPNNHLTQGGQQTPTPMPAVSNPEISQDPSNLPDVIHQSQIQSQSAMLNHPHAQPIQRQAMANQISQKFGNQHMLKVIQAMKQNQNSQGDKEQTTPKPASASPQQAPPIQREASSLLGGGSTDIDFNNMDMGSTAFGFADERLSEYDSDSLDSDLYNDILDFQGVSATFTRPDFSFNDPSPTDTYQSTMLPGLGYDINEDVTMSPYNPAQDNPYEQFLNDPILNPGPSYGFTPSQPVGPTVTDLASELGLTPEGERWPDGTTVNPVILNDLSNARIDNWRDVTPSEIEGLLKGELYINDGQIEVNPNPPSTLGFTSDTPPSQIFDAPPQSNSVEYQAAFQGLQSVFPNLDQADQNGLNQLLSQPETVAQYTQPELENILFPNNGAGGDTTSPPTIGFTSDSPTSQTFPVPEGRVSGVEYQAAIQGLRNLFPNLDQADQSALNQLLSQPETVAQYTPDQLEGMLYPDIGGANSNSQPSYYDPQPVGGSTDTSVNVIDLANTVNFDPNTIDPVVLQNLQTATHIQWNTFDPPQIWQILQGIYLVDANGNLQLNPNPPLNNSNITAPITSPDTPDTPDTTVYGPSLGAQDGDLIAGVPPGVLQDGIPSYDANGNFYLRPAPSSPNQQDTGPSTEGGSSSESGVPGLNSQDAVDFAIEAFANGHTIDEIESRYGDVWTPVITQATPVEDMHTVFYGRVAYYNFIGGGGGILYDFDANKLYIMPEAGVGSSLRTNFHYGPMPVSDLPTPGLEGVVNLDTGAGVNYTGTHNLEDGSYQGGPGTYLDGGGVTLTPGGGFSTSVEGHVPLGSGISIVPLGDGTFAVTGSDTPGLSGEVYIRGIYELDLNRSNNNQDEAGSGPQYNILLDGLPPGI